jgi:hypothetical protein
VKKTYICLHQVGEHVEFPSVEWGRKEDPAPRLWGTNCQRLKLLQKDIFHTVCSVNLNSHVCLSCACPSVSISTIDVTYQPHTCPSHPRAVPQPIS